ncbi:rho GTPase-activating protein 22-like [Poecilia formosa]|uniref:rho GTPase-activating protein 22-like n=1 Tax=Poecilia formosa TaxID=48698 RepID=UPI0004447035|nr:PREDICTED: rho GTPase-activating protein 22-like [Poecilia formosa]
MGLSCFKSWKYDSTGHKGNRDVLASPGSYFFLSNSAGQGDEWLKSLNKGVWIPFTGVFGQRLDETVLYERRYGVRLVPLVVEQCVTFIRERGLHEVGLFRQPGRTSLVKELQEAFDSGERPSFDSGTDVHTVASLLKLYLRQLPEPLVPYSHYQDFLLCGQKLLSDRTVGLEELTNLLHELPVANFNLLNFICQFLNEVQSCSSSNKMNVQNLATVFGPNILRAKAEDPQSIMGATKLVQVLMSELIRQHKSLFAKFPPSACSHPSATPLKQPHLQPSPCLRQLSLPLIADHSSESGQPAAHADHSSCIFSAAGKSDLLSGQKKHLGHRYTSSHPENCFYPLPSSSESINHHPGRHKGDFYKYHSGQGSSSANAQATTTNPQLQTESSNQGAMGWQRQEKAASASWSCRGAEEEGEVPEAASGGSSQAQEDSTPSVYDNLDRASLSHTLENVPTENFDLDSPGINVGMCETEVDQAELGTAGDSSSSWSSCEVLPLDKSKDELGVSSPDIPPKRSRMLPLNQRREQEICDKDDHEDNGVEGNGAKQHPSSWASCSVISISPLSTGSSEVFLPSGAPDLQVQESHLESRDTHSLLAKLRQQMAQQKAEYQNRIERLERCNDALERQVAVLRLSLEQQRRSQSVAEIKIRNMERAKADADRRNTTLQREMELFFRTYGEIRRRRGDLGRAGGGSI